jgi:hypothetical protein
MVIEQKTTTNDLTPLQVDEIRIALQFHAAMIQEILARLQPIQVPPSVDSNE